MRLDRPLILAVVLGLAFLPNPATALPDHPVISEALVDVTGAESAGEFVELYNPTGDTVAIGGWDIAYKAAAGGSFSSVATIPSGRTIPPFGYFLVGGDAVSPTPDHVDTSLGFTATGGHIALRNASNAVVDKLGYGNADSPESAAVPACAIDQSFERRPGAAAASKGNGQDVDDNRSDFDTRATAQPQNSSSVELPDSTLGSVAPAADFLYTLSATANVTLTDPDRNNKSGAAETTTITVKSLADPTGISLVVQETANNASTFDLATAGGSLGLTLGASDAANRKIRVRATGDTITIQYRDIAPAETVSASIRFLGVGRIVLNEVVFNPTGTDQGNEWVELYNADTTSIDVSGWTLTNEDAATVMEMPTGTVMPAGAYLQWRIDAAGTSDTDFSDGKGEVYSGTATTVTLTNTNDQVSLYGSTTRDKNSLVDFFQYSTNSTISEPSDAQNAVDVGLWPSTDTYTDAASAAEGASLGILPDGGDNHRPGDWSIDPTPTPQGTNSFVQPPGVPSNVDAVGGLEKVTVTWAAATAGDNPLAGYRLFRGLTASALSSIGGILTGTSYLDTAVTPSQTYYYALRAEDTAGVQGDTSSLDSAIPQPYVPPAAPANLDAQPGVNQVTVSWDTATKGTYSVSLYRVYRGTDPNALSQLASGFLSTRRYTDTTGTVGVTYYYAARAEDTNGVMGDTSSIDSAAPQPYVAPGVPANLTASGNPFKNDLRWDTPSAGSYPLQKYRVFRRTASTGYSQIVEQSVSKTAYSDSAVSVGVQYWYTVRATDTTATAGDSSSEVTVVAQGYNPAPPLGTNVQINEIMFDPSGSEPANEWVELYNPTDTPIGMDSWIFEDNGASFRIPVGTTIAAKGYFVLGYSATAAGGSVDLIYGVSASGIQFANSADTARLRTDTQLVDEVGYISSSWGGNEPRSLSRKFSGYASQEITNWGQSLDTGGTPRAQNNVDTLPPLISHTPVARTVWNRDMGIHATITDNVDKELEIGQATLYYRTAGETSYRTVTMTRTAITNWDGVIPAQDVDTPTIEYYIRGKDASNNYGAYATPDTPQQVTVVVIDTKVVVNEIMYDPATGEPDNEWVELYNYGATAENVSNWKFTDGEGVFNIPNGTTIPAGGYLVLKNTDSAATGVSGIVYGESAPSIQLNSLLATITDQVIVSDANGLIVDEVNYSSTWGASNVMGPNNLTLERLKPTMPSNESGTWIYSYQQQGTPGSANGSKIIRNVTIEPSYINPLIGETALISFTAIIDSDVSDNTAALTIRIRDYAGNIIRTVALAQAGSPGVYTRSFIWNGTNDLGETQLDIFMVEVVAEDKTGEVCTHKVDDRMLLGFNDRYSEHELYTGARQMVRVDYFTAKPVIMTIRIVETDEAESAGAVIRHLVESQPVGAGNQVTVWDGRRDDGSFHLEGTAWPFSAVGFTGNALIALPRYQIATETKTPRTFFNPDNGESVTLWYRPGDSGTVSITVRRASDGQLMRTLATNALRDNAYYSVSWDGKDESAITVGNGLYLILIEGVVIDGWQRNRALEEIEVRR